MARERMKLFGDETEFDVSAFAPRGETRPQPLVDEVKALAERMNFRSREAASPPLAAPPKAVAVDAGPDVLAPQKRKPRRHRTGRTAQLNVRVTPATMDAVYAIADEEGWLVGETVERALAALQRERAARED